MSLLAIASLVGTAGSMVGSAIANRKAQKLLDRETQDNQNEFNSEYNKDYTQRADVQSALGRMRDLMKERSDARRGTAAVMGSTPEAVVAEQKVDNKALGDTTSNIAGQGAAYKDIVRQRFNQNRSMLRSKQMAIYNDQANQFAQFGSSAVALGAQSMAPTATATQDTEVVSNNTLINGQDTKNYE